MTATLKPCPFCGGKVKYIMGYLDVHDKKPIGISCKKCKTEVQFYTKKEDLIRKESLIIKRWNRLKTPDKRK